MKIGLRTPSLKKSFKAKTTGRAKRALKRAVIPAYGKKGTGFIKNPKKAMYNKVYRKTSVDGLASVRNVSSNSKSNVNKKVATNTKPQNKKNVSSIITKDGKAKIGRKFYSKKSILRYRLFFLICGWLIIICGCFLLPIGLIFIALGIFFLICANSYKKIAAQCN
jgi:hypothetical protein